MEGGVDWWCDCQNRPRYTVLGGWSGIWNNVRSPGFNPEGDWNPNLPPFVQDPQLINVGQSGSYGGNVTFRGNSALTGVGVGVNGMMRIIVNIRGNAITVSADIGSGGIAFNQWDPMTNAFFNSRLVFDGVCA
jgi:hypothetical protein